VAKTLQLAAWLLLTAYRNLSMPCHTVPSLTDQVGTPYNSQSHSLNTGIICTQVHALRMSSVYLKLKFD